MNLKEYLKVQELEFVNAFNNSAFFPIGVQSINCFPKYIDFEQSFSFPQNIAKNNAFIRSVYSGKQFELWVNVNYKGYRKAFLNFVKEFYNLDINQVNSEWHVDHVLNLAFGKKAGVQYVRLCLLNSKHNIAYGSKLEKLYKHIYTSKKNIFLINYLYAMKVLNIRLSQSWFRC